MRLWHQKEEPDFVLGFMGLALVSESGSHYPVAVHGPLTVVARAQALGAQTSAVATCGLSICSSWALKNRLHSCDALA